jgi:hypothetical protein
MSTIREEIAEGLLARRQLSASTLKTYVSLIGSMCNKMNLASLSELDMDAVTEYINAMKSNQSKKTLCSALYVLTGNEDIQRMMGTFIRAVEDKYKEHQYTPAEESKRLSFDQVKAIVDRFMVHAKDTKQALQDAILCALVSGVYQKPRRLLDWTAMKLRNADRDKDNFILGNNFVFNTYKTKSTYGTQTVVIHPTVKKLIAAWKRLDDPSDYLLVQRNGQPYSSPTLCKKLKTMFGASCNMLRHTYLNDVTYNDDLMKKLQETSSEMGSSMESAQNYYLKKT